MIKILFLLLSYFLLHSRCVWQYLFTNHLGSFGKVGKEAGLQEHSF